MRKCNQSLLDIHIVTEREQKRLDRLIKRGRLFVIMDPDTAFKEFGEYYKHCEKVPVTQEMIDEMLARYKAKKCEERRKKVFEFFRLCW